MHSAIVAICAGVAQFSYILTLQLLCYRKIANRLVQYIGDKRKLLSSTEGGEQPYNAAELSDYAKYLGIEPTSQLNLVNVDGASILTVLDRRHTSRVDCRGSTARPTAASLVFAPGRRWGCLLCALVLFVISCTCHTVFLLQMLSVHSLCEQYCTKLDKSTYEHPLDNYFRTLYKDLAGLYLGNSTED